MNYPGRRHVFARVFAPVVIVFVAYVSVEVSAAPPASEGIVGTWLVESATGDPAHVQIYAKTFDGIQMFFGKFTFFPGEDENGVNIGEAALDTLNPDEALRSRRLLGLDMLERLVYDKEKNRWDGGTVYDPDVGTYYKCRLTLEDADHLELRGYIGISLFGRSEIWTRLKDGG